MVEFFKFVDSLSFWHWIKFILSVLFIGGAVGCALGGIVRIGNVFNK